MKTIYDRNPLIILSSMIFEKNESMMASGIFPDLTFYGPGWLPIPEIFKEEIKKYDSSIGR